MTSRIACEPSGRRLVPVEGAALVGRLGLEGVLPRGGAVAGPGVVACGGMAGAPMAGPADWGVFCCGCCGVVGVPALGSALCWVGGGAVMVAADWVDTEVSLSSTVGMGSPGAGSRCWIGWPEDGEC
ncbi:hypothetical protein [Streptomyces rimosus]|uniref:hypothetical protein n=1 Tax=Streptomyces rimosus TaxID=1927 RepID=UPI000517F6B7|nr:hypothetical protein [Streptomyces rimosus]